MADQLRQLGVEPHLYLGFGYISLPRRAAVRVGQQELHAITQPMAASTPVQGVDLYAITLGQATESGFTAQDVRVNVDSTGGQHAVLFTFDLF